MPKFPWLTSQQIIKVLEKKGFVLDRSKGSHRIYFHPESRKRVVVPFHRKDLPQGTFVKFSGKQALAEKNSRINAEN